jgi:hypothetical protein
MANKPNRHHQRIQPYDWVDTNAAVGQLPFDGGNQKDQFLFSTDMTINF